MPDGRTQEGHRFGPWEAKIGMIELKPGIWYHLAVQWDSDKQFVVSKGTRHASQARVFLNGKNLNTDAQWSDNPAHLLDAYVAPLPGPALEMISQDHGVLFDELRVSDIERVPFKTFADNFPVPTSAYGLDDHTLLLMHFDGDFKGTGKDNTVLEATFTNLR